MANPSTSAYNSDSNEVLSGLDPVRKRPSMYTDTSGLNHLAYEVVDNSVDEALAGHVRSRQVILHQHGRARSYPRFPGRRPTGRAGI